ncbi:MAG: KH domain-containing protein [Clostridia bacterium]|nr:KH domain-containing protein [Clostridia bacterium]
MLELIKYIVGNFATSEVEYVVEEKGDVVNVTIILDESDMGRVIGRQGKLAKALRTLVRAGSSKDSKKYNIDIKEKGEIE